LIAAPSRIQPACRRIGAAIKRPVRSGTSDGADNRSS
jgi:hypothetical protein